MEGVDLDSHPFDVPAIRGLIDGIELHPRCTCFVGHGFYILDESPAVVGRCLRPIALI